VVIDEFDGEPVPFLNLSVGGERLESDATGAFVTNGRHARGRLEFELSNRSYVVGDWAPERAEPLVVPARVGPTFFFVLDGSAPDLFAFWLPPGPASSVSALGVGYPAFLRLEPPSLVRLRAEERSTPSAGERVFVSYTDHLCGRAEIGPGRGLGEPLAVTLMPCGFLSVTLESARDVEWHEDERLSLALLTRAGDVQSRISWEQFIEPVFVVMEPGERWLEARYGDQEIGRIAVSTQIGRIVSVVLPVSLPELELEEREPALEVRGTVTSARSLPVECRLRLTRRSDGVEALIPVDWREDGRGWVGHIEGEAPAGEYRSVLELEPPFAYAGPAAVHVPAAEELVFALDDDVPRFDVYFAPSAAETGEPVLAFDSLVFLAGGLGIGGDDFCSPSVPVLVGHPRDVPFFWTCSAPGRRPVCGRWEPDGGEGDLRLCMTLERGWGATLYVGDADCMALDGVRVLCDGVPAAVTDASGHACLGGERPRRIELEYRDWILDPDNRGELEADGSFEPHRWYVSAYLRPPGRR
jgi:hypothetical protein